MKVVAVHGVSVSLACRTFQISETCYRYSPILSDENEEIADWLERLTAHKCNWGFGLCFFVPAQRAELWLEPQTGLPDLLRTGVVNLRIKPKKRLRRDTPEPLAVPDRPNETWSATAPAGDCIAIFRERDLMADQLADGRSIRTLNVLDHCTAGYRVAMPREWTSTARVLH